MARRTTPIPSLERRLVGRALGAPSTVAAKGRGGSTLGGGGVQGQAGERALWGGAGGARLGGVRMRARRTIPSR